MLYGRSFYTLPLTATAMLAAAQLSLASDDKWFIAGFPSGVDVCRAVWKGDQNLDSYMYDMQRYDSNVCHNFKDDAICTRLDGSKMSSDKSNCGKMPDYITALTFVSNYDNFGRGCWFYEKLDCGGNAVHYANKGDGADGCFDLGGKKYSMQCIDDAGI